MLVYRRSCPVNCTKQGRVIDHSHVRYHMVGNIPDYDARRRSKMIEQVKVDEARAKIANLIKSA